MTSVVDAIKRALTPLARNARAGRALGLVIVVPALLCAIAALALAPALASASRIPVAVVNLDEGATDADGRMVAAGEDFVDTLDDSEELAWSVVDEETSDRGIDDGTYALALVIPADYSEHVASIHGTDPKQATIEVVSSGSENVLATEAGSAVLRQVQSRLKSDLGENYMLSVLSEVRGQSSKLTLAADGSAMMVDALDAVAEGNDQLADGLSQTAAGTGALAEGIGTISQGVAAAGTGAEAIAAGLEAAGSQGAGALASGADMLAQGLDTVSATTVGMGEQVETVGASLEDVSARLTSATGSLAAMGEVTGVLEEHGETLAAALATATATGTSLKEHAEQAVGGIDAMRTGIDEVASGAGALATELAGNEDGSVEGIEQELSRLDVRYDELSVKLDGLLNDLDAALSGATTGGTAGSGDDSSAEGAAQTEGASDGEPAATIDADAVKSLREKIANIQSDLAALDNEREALSQRVTAAAGTASGLATSATSASKGMTALDEAQAGIEGDLNTLKETAESLAGVEEDLTGAVSNLATQASQAVTDVFYAQAALAGTTLEDGTEVPGLASSVTLLGKGVTAIGGQLSSEGAIGAGASGLSQGASALGDALSTMAEGTATLGTGNMALAQALDAVNQGVGSLGSGFSSLATVQEQLGEGTRQIAEATGGVTDTLEEAGDALADVSANHAERAEVAASPVRFRTSERDRVSEVASIVPVAVAVAVWVGALASLLLVPELDPRAILARRGAVAVASQLAQHLAIALAQGLLIGVVGAIAAGLQGSSAVAFVACALLGSAACAALVQAVRLCAGRLTVAVLVGALMFQLLCAGLVLPSFFTEGLFSALGNVLPLNVLAEALRLLAASTTFGVFTADAYLAAVFAVSLGVSLVRSMGFCERRALRLQ